MRHSRELSQLLPSQFINYSSVGSYTDEQRCYHLLGQMCIACAFAWLNLRQNRSCDFCEDHVLIITLRPKQNACHFRTQTNDYFEQWKLVYWRIYALPVFGELNQWTHVPVIMSDTHKIWTIYPELIISRTHLSVWSRQGGRNKARLWGRDSSAVGTRYMVPSLLFSIWTTCIVVCSHFILVYAKSIVRLRSVFCGM